MQVSLGQNIVWQTWTPTFTGFSANPTGYTARWAKLNDKTAIIQYISGTPGTSNSTAKTMTLPVTAANTSTQTLITQRLDNNVRAAGSAKTAANSSTLTLYQSAADANWTASGNCDFLFTMVIEIV